MKIRRLTQREEDVIHAQMQAQRVYRPTTTEDRRERARMLLADLCNEGRTLR